MSEPRRHGEDGYLLLWLSVVAFLLLLSLSIAAPMVSRALERDREVEAARRGDQYARAIRKFYQKFQRYPTSVEQLDNTAEQRFLRRHYIDPLTGKDFRLIPLGQQKTQIKGFFGEPLEGVPMSNIGSTIGTPTPSSFGSNSTSAFGTAATNGLTGTPGQPQTGIGANGNGQGVSGFGNNSGTDYKGGSGPIVGVGTNKTGTAIVAVNGETDFAKWEFQYDPRVELMRSQSNILGGGAGAPSSIGGSTIGSPIGGQPGAPGSTGSSVFGSGQGSGLTGTPAAGTVSAPAAGAGTGTQ